MNAEVKIFDASGNDIRNLEGRINQWLASTTGTAQIIATNLAVSQIQGAGGAGYPNAPYAIVTVGWKSS